MFTKLGEMENMHPENAGDQLGNSQNEIGSERGWMHFEAYVK